jgi:acetyltransferase-like isoleucine patch superfamily enzyme
MLSWCQVEGSNPTRVQPALCIGSGIIKFGKNVHLGCFPSPNFLNGVCYLEARNTTARIEIGDGCWINNNFAAIAESSTIVIGSACLIGPSVTIFDSDFHGLQPQDRNNLVAVRRERVFVGDNVFIGANVVILRGVEIGRNSVVAAGSVVTRNIPANVIAAGNPARVIRAL